MNSRPILTSATRALLTKRTCNVIANNGVALRNSSYYKPAASWKPPHLDEMPIPQGSWHAANDATQKRYNIQLAVGISLFLFTLTFIKTSGLIFFNASPPELPEE